MLMHVILLLHAVILADLAHLNKPSEFRLTDMHAPDGHYCTNVGNLQPVEQDCTVRSHNSNFYRDLGCSLTHLHQRPQYPPEDCPCPAAELPRCPGLLYRHQKPPAVSSHASYKGSIARYICGITGSITRQTCSLDDSIALRGLYINSSASPWSSSVSPRSPNLVDAWCIYNWCTSVIDSNLMCGGSDIWI